MSKAFGEEIGGHLRNYRINMHCCAAAWPRSAGSMRATSRIAVQAVAALVPRPKLEPAISFIDAIPPPQFGTRSDVPHAAVFVVLLDRSAEVPAVRLSEST